MSEGIEFPVGGISDGEVRLRLRADSDVPALVAACRDPEVQRWTRVPEGYDERAGYSFDGMLRSHTVIKGTRRDMAIYSLLRGELR